MALYEIRFFRSRPGTSVRTGQGAVAFDVGDDATAIRYVKATWPENLEAHESADLWQGDPLVWESRPPT